MLEKLKPINTHAGLNTVDDSHAVDDNESPDMRNSDISDPGALKTRPGMTKTSTSALSGGAVMALMYFRSDVEGDTNMALTADGNLQTV